MSDLKYGGPHPIGCVCTICKGPYRPEPETVDTQARRDIAGLLARVEALEAAQPLSDAAARKWSEDSKEHARTMADRDAWKARAESAEAMVVKLEDADEGRAYWGRRYDDAVKAQNVIASERDEQKRQAALYHADMMNVRDHRDRLAAEVQRRRIEFDEFAAKAEAERDRMRGVVDAARSAHAYAWTRFTGERGEHNCGGCPLCLLWDALKSLAALEAK